MYRRTIGLATALVALAVTCYAAEDANRPSDVLTLDEAISLTLTESPTMSVYPYAVRAADARTLQAGLRPNPELEIEIGEFAGTGDREGFTAAESSIVVGQPIELGGKRVRRKQVASVAGELVAWDYESAKLDVIRDVKQAFTAVQAGHERVMLAEQLVELAQQVRATVAQRVEAGKDSPVEGLQADLVLSRSRMGRQEAVRALDAARHALAAQWGGRPGAWQVARAGFFDPVLPVSLEEMLQAIDANPDLARQTTEERHSQASLRLAKAMRVPDVTIGGGIQRFEETDDSSFILGLSLPLPLFDRNQGGIAEALAGLAKTRQQGKAVAVRTRAALAEAVNDLASACSQASILRDDILPKAQEAFDISQEGYLRGKFDYLYVLEAERTLFKSRLEYIDVVERCHRARAEVERLTGGAAARRGDEPRIDIKNQPSERGETR
jgi:cobalt-zinc-cadmium efflux system outer membrane protein